MVKRLISLKRGGFPIFNSEENILLWIDNFNKTEEQQKMSSCVGPLRNITILQNGDVDICGFLDN